MWLVLVLASAASDRFSAQLLEAYALRFQVKESKHLVIAHRGTDAYEAVLYGEAFLREVAPLYFDQTLDTPIRVALFEDSRTFRRLTKMDEYGYYAYTDHTIYTYARSGYGTLWHEMMHALIHRFAKCSPHDWFNEGLSSFYEMAALSEGKIIDGFTNWRHPILLDAIKAKKLTPLAALLKKKETEASSDLALARFLFVYLWMHGKLVPFARSYLAGGCNHPREKLEAILQTPLATIEKDLLARAVALEADVQLEPLAVTPQER